VLDSGVVVSKTLAAEATTAIRQTIFALFAIGNKLNSAII